jgi:hypothetical protein
MSFYSESVFQWGLLAAISAASAIAIFFLINLLPQDLAPTELPSGEQVTFKEEQRL